MVCALVSGANEREDRAKMRTFTRKQLRDGWRGEFYRDGEFLGLVYLIEGLGYVLDVEYGKVNKIVETHSPASFKKIGKYRVSASQEVQRWTV